MESAAVTKLRSFQTALLFTLVSARRRVSTLFVRLTTATSGRYKFDCKLSTALYDLLVLYQSSFKWPVFSKQSRLDSAVIPSSLLQPLLLPRTTKKWLLFVNVLNSVLIRAALVRCTLVSPPRPNRRNRSRQCRRHRHRVQRCCVKRANRPRIVRRRLHKSAPRAAVLLAKAPAVPVPAMTSVAAMRVNPLVPTVSAIR